VRESGERDSIAVAESQRTTAGTPTAVTPGGRSRM